IDLGVHTVLGDRLLRAAKGTVKVRRDDALAAKAAEYRLVSETDGGRNFGDAVRDRTFLEILKMVGKDLPHLAGTRESCVGILFDGPHQYPLHLVRKLRID